jgi:MFS family permease
LWLILGLSLFLMAVVGFAMAISLLRWALAMVIFTIGEIIVFPTEYMFIYRIAHPKLRGMHYGAQNFSYLGSAVGPVLCGLVLASYPPQWMLYMLSNFHCSWGLFLSTGRVDSRRKNFSM